MQLHVKNPFRTCLRESLKLHAWKITVSFIINELKSELIITKKARNCFPVLNREIFRSLPIYLIHAHTEM